MDITAERAASPGLDDPYIYDESLVDAEHEALLNTARSKWGDIGNPLITAQYRAALEQKLEARKKWYREQSCKVPRRWVAQDANGWFSPEMVFANDLRELHGRGERPSPAILEAALSHPVNGIGLTVAELWPLSRGDYDLLVLHLDDAEKLEVGRLQAAFGNADIIIP